MDENTASPIQTGLYEIDAVWEMLEKVVIVDIIDLDDLVVKALEQLVVQRQS